jgi:PAS domain S-box-containing protein
VSVHDPHTGAVLDANDRYCERVGYEREELVGTRVGEVVSDVEPFTIGRARQRLRAVAEEGPQRFEWRDETREGDPVGVRRSSSVRWRSRASRSPWPASATSASDDAARRRSGRCTRSSRTASSGSRRRSTP